MTCPSKCPNCGCTQHYYVSHSHVYKCGLVVNFPHIFDNPMMANFDVWKITRDCERDVIDMPFLFSNLKVGDCFFLTGKPLVVYEKTSNSEDGSDNSDALGHNFYEFIGPFEAVTPVFFPDSLLTE